MQIRVFVPVFLATHSVPCLSDLEAGLVIALERAGISPIRGERSLDPFEVDIDAPTAGNLSFATFGVGSLRSHPLLLHYFPEEPAVSLTYQELLNHLQEYCEKDSLIRLGAVFEKDNFERWLCSKYQVTNTLRLGVVLQSDLQRELIIAREILSKQRKVEQALERSCLDNAMKEMRVQNISTGDNEHVPKVIPRSKLTAEFIEKCKAALETPYPPAYGKLRGVIQSIVLNATDSPTSEQMLEVCCEYAMLCLGKRKQRMKFFDGPIKENGIKVEMSTDVEALPVPESDDKGPVAKKKLKSIESIGAHEVGITSVSTSGPMFHSLREVPMATDMRMKVSTNYQPEVATSSALKSCIPEAHSGTKSNAEIGRWGEAVVFNYLLLTQSNAVVEWVNETQETLASYDIIVTSSHKGFQSSTFVEVKSTRFDDRNVFALSYQELEFMMNHPRPRYDIYRVFNAGDSEKVRISILRNVFDLIRSKEVTLCLAI